MSYLKTKQTDEDVIVFLNTIENDEKKQDCFNIINIISLITGHKAKMWGKSMVGFGSYTYKTKSGKEGEWFLSGFSPRKLDISLHLMLGLDNEVELLSKLGKYKKGKGCVYIKRLSDIDINILKKLIKNTFESMKRIASKTN